MKPSTSFPSLTAAESHLRSMSAQTDGFPIGWTTRRVPSGVPGIDESIYYSPRLNYRFRGILQARAFLDCLGKVNDADEEAAWQLFQKEKDGQRVVRRTPEEASSSVKIKMEYDQFGVVPTTAQNGNEIAATEAAAVVAASNRVVASHNTKLEADSEERDQDTVTEDISGGKLFDATGKKIDMVDLTITTDSSSQEANELRGGSNNSQKKKEDKTSEKKLIMLTPDQAKETKYPHGCQVVYKYKHNERLNSTCISVGVVLSVNVSLQGDFIYEIMNDSATKNNEEKALMVDEKSLAYAPTAAVYYQPGSSQLSMQEATVLLASRTITGDFRYSVLTTSEMGEHTIQHNVVPEKLSFRSVPAAKDDDNSTKTSPSLQSGLGATEESNKSTPKAAEDGVDATSQQIGEKGQIVPSGNPKDAENEYAALADTDDAEMLSILEGPGDGKNPLQLTQSLTSTEDHVAAAENQANEDANPIHTFGTGSSKNAKKKNHRQFQNKRKMDHRSRKEPPTMEASGSTADQVKSGPKRRRSNGNSRTAESTNPPGANNRHNNTGGGQKQSKGKYGEARHQPNSNHLWMSKKAARPNDNKASKQRSSYGDIKPRNQPSGSTQQKKQTAQHHIRFD